MLENNNENEIPEVEFSFKGDGMNEEERKKEIEELLKKRNELLSSMGIPIPTDSEIDLEEMRVDYPRRSR